MSTSSPVASLPAPAPPPTESCTVDELIERRPLNWNEILDRGDLVASSPSAAVRSESGLGRKRGWCENDYSASSTSSSSGLLTSGSSVSTSPTSLISGEESDSKAGVKANNVAQEDACYHVDLKLLHLACDAPTRAADVGSILRLANRIERSVTDAAAECSKRTKANDGTSIAAAAASSAPAIRTDLFVDRSDGRTPLHRACAPRDEGEGADDDEEAAEEDVTSDLSDASDGEEEEEDGHAIPAPEQQPAMPTMTATKRGPNKTNDKTTDHRESDHQWIFETTCLLLGLCPGMATVQDCRGETPLHLVARLSPSSATDDDLQRDVRALDLIKTMAARSILQFHPEVVSRGDRWGNTPLHRAILSREDGDAAGTDTSSSGGGCGGLDTFAATLIAADPSVVVQPNGAGSTPLHLLLSGRFRHHLQMRQPQHPNDSNSSYVYELVRYMTLLRPDAVLVRNSWGYTPLHCCVERHPDVRLIELLMQVEQRYLQTLSLQPVQLPVPVPLPTSSLLLKDDRGFTPLHLAALDSMADPAIMTTLLARCPQSTLVPDRTGRTSIDACWGAHVYCASRFRRAARNYYNDSVVIHEEDGGEDDAEVVEGRADAVRRELLSGQTGEFWKKLMALLWAASKSAVVPGGAAAAATPATRMGKFYELHAASVALCPPDVLDVALFLYPHQLCQRDGTGDLPLHAAARSHQTNREVCDGGAWKREQRRRHVAMLQAALGNQEGHVADPTALLQGAIQEDLTSSDEESSVGSLSTDARSSSSRGAPFREYDESSDDGSDDESTVAGGSVERSARASKPPKLSKANGTIETLLAAYPESVRIPDASGRLPLNIALVSGKTWSNGIRSIVAAAPQILGMRDATTGLYPFMLAATVGRTMEVAEAEAAFAERTASEASALADRARMESRPTNPPLQVGTGGAHLPPLLNLLVNNPASSLSAAFPVVSTTETHSVLAQTVAVADAKAEEKGRELAEDMRGLNTVFVLLCCRPELVQSGIP